MMTYPHRKITRRHLLGTTLAGLSSPTAFDRGDFPYLVPLAGAWALRADPAGRGEQENWAVLPAEPGTETWTPAQVPGCWERDGIRATVTGPVWYRKDLAPAEVPVLYPGTRLWWECDAVSYHTVGWVNGVRIGEHTGLWDAFVWEVPEHQLRPGQSLALALQIEKPGGKRFPLPPFSPELPLYLWSTWGGPWQQTRLRQTGPCRLARVRASGNASGLLTLEITVDLPPGQSAGLSFTLRDPEGAVVAKGEAAADRSGTIRSSLNIAAPRLWHPSHPHLYTLTVTARAGGAPSDRQELQVGFREVSVQTNTVLLNGQPIYFRAALHPGWYEQERCPNPSPEAIRQELEQIKALGFNGVKLCLWVPSPLYFDLADKLGLLLWIELPLWQPGPGENGRQEGREGIADAFRRIITRIGDHPSALLWSIGSPGGKEQDPTLTARLYQLLKEETRSPLIRESSGAVERSGGPTARYADFRDCHLYCDLPQTRPALDRLAPAWRSRQPFLLGEFNDQDAFRDLSRLLRDRKKAPWWADAAGGVSEQRDRMQAGGIAGRETELIASSREQALLVRKYALELARSCPFTSGYVLTGLRDTPFSTSGLFSDSGAPRFSGEEFLPSNADTVLFLEPDQPRDWTAGSDRPAYPDRFGVQAGETVRRTLGISHYGNGTVEGMFLWEVTAGGEALAKGRVTLPPVEPGTVRSLGEIEFTAPQAPTPTRLTIQATLPLGRGQTALNRWPLWVFPAVERKPAAPVGLYDPAGHLHGLAEVIGRQIVPLASADGAPLAGGGGMPPLVVATAWRPMMRDFLRAGGRLLLLQPGASAAGSGDGLPAEPLPFWREAMRLFEPHPSWGAFPHGKRSDFCFYGLASECAFDRAGAALALGEGAIFQPVLTRVDTRSYRTHPYILAGGLGPGRFLLTTLRPQGGLGDQPSGLRRHITGVYLLRQWLQWLETG